MGGTLFGAERGGFLSENPSGIQLPALYLPPAEVSGATVLGVQLTDNEDLDFSRQYDPSSYGRAQNRRQAFYLNTAVCSEGDLITDFIHQDANTSNLTVGKPLYLAPNGTVTDDAVTWGGVRVGTVWRPFEADEHQIVVQGLGFTYTAQAKNNATPPPVTQTFGPIPVKRTTPGWLGVKVKIFRSLGKR